MCFHNRENIICSIIRGVKELSATMWLLFKLIKEAEKRWHRIKRYKLIHLVMEGKRSINGELLKIA